MSKIRVTTEQMAAIKAIARWLMANTQIIGRQQAEGFAYRLVTSANFDKSEPCVLRVSGEDIEVPPVESLA